jgi:phosphate transport system permease protein
VIPTVRTSQSKRQLNVAPPELPSDGSEGLAIHLSSASSANGYTERLNKSDLAKRFRLDEFLAEKLITTVALISLAAIVLIFVFVFREAAPVFLPTEKPAGTLQVQHEEEETYGEEYLGEGAQRLNEETESKPSNETSGSEGDASFANLTSSAWQPVSSDPNMDFFHLLSAR